MSSSIDTIASPIFESSPTIASFSCTPRRALRLVVLNGKSDLGTVTGA